MIEIEPLENGKLLKGALCCKHIYQKPEDFEVMYRFQDLNRIITHLCKECAVNQRMQLLAQRIEKKAKDVTPDKPLMIGVSNLMYTYSGTLIDLPDLYVLDPNVPEGSSLSEQVSNVLIELLKAPEVLELAPTEVLVKHDCLVNGQVRVYVVKEETVPKCLSFLHAHAKKEPTLYRVILPDVNGRLPTNEYFSDALYYTKSADEVYNARSK